MVSLDQRAFGFEPKLIVVLSGRVKFYRAGVLHYPCDSGAGRVVTNGGRFVPSRQEVFSPFTVPLAINSAVIELRQGER